MVVNTCSILKVVIVVMVVMLGFYVQPTAKVIRRRDLGLKSHPKDGILKMIAACIQYSRVFASETFEAYIVIFATLLEVINNLTLMGVFKAVLLIVYLCCLFWCQFLYFYTFYVSALYLV